MRKNKFRNWNTLNSGFRFRLCWIFKWYDIDEDQRRAFTVWKWAAGLLSTKWPSPLLRNWS